jgi:hypothetical protein
MRFKRFLGWFLTFAAVVLLALEVAVVARAYTPSPPIEEFPAKRWTGYRNKTLTNLNARLVAYYKESGDVAADTATAPYRVVCSYNLASAYWSFAPTITGSWWVWDQQCNPDSMIEGWTSRAEIGGDGIAGGTGDITGIHTVSGGAWPNYLKILGDSLTAAPSLYLKIGGSGSTLDSRYINEGQANGVTYGMVNDWAVSPSDLYPTNTPSAGLIPSYASANQFTWIAPSGGGSVTSVTSATTDYITVANGTTTPALTFLPGGLDSRFLNASDMTETAYFSTSGSITSTSQINAGTTGDAAGLYLYTGSGANKVGLLATPNAALSHDIQFPSSVGYVGKYLKVLSGDNYSYATLGWADGAGGTVNSVVAGTGISVDATDPTAPIVALTTTSPLWVKATGETRNLSFNGTFTAGSVITAPTFATSGASAGSLTLKSTTAQTSIIAQNSGTANINLWLPAAQGSANSILTNNGSGVTSWNTDVNVSTGTFSSTATSTLDLTAGSPVKQARLKAPIDLVNSYTLTFPYDDGSAGTQLTTNGSGILYWSAAYAGKVPASDTVGWSLSRGPSVDTYLKYYIDQDYVWGDSTYKAENSDNSILVVDTSRVVTETETSPLFFSGRMTVTAGAIFDSLWADFAHVDSLRADSLYALHGHIDDLEVLNGLEAGGIYTDDIAQTANAWWMLADSAYWSVGGLFEHKLTVGSNTGADGLVVNGTAEIAGTTYSHSVQATGSIHATTKMSAADSINAYKSLRAGTASVAGSLVLWDGSGNTLTASAPAMGSNLTYTFPAGQVISGHILFTRRGLMTSPSYAISAYVPGLTATHIPSVEIAACANNGTVPPAANDLRWCATVKADTCIIYCIANMSDYHMDCIFRPPSLTAASE